MPEPDRPRPVALWLLIASLVFLGIGALYGGTSFLLDPTGGRIQLPISLLEGSVFPDYRIPGAVLFVTFGLLPWPVAFALLRQTPRPAFLGYAWPWLGALGLALGLVIWLVVQALTIGLAGGIQAVYATFALVLLGLVLVPSVRSRNHMPSSGGD